MAHIAASGGNHDAVELQALLRSLAALSGVVNGQAAQLTAEFSSRFDPPRLPQRLLPASWPSRCSF